MPSTVGSQFQNSNARRCAPMLPLWAIWSRTGHGECQVGKQGAEAKMDAGPRLAIRRWLILMNQLAIFNEYVSRDGFTQLMFINDGVSHCFVKKIQNENQKDSRWVVSAVWQDSDSEKEQAAALRANRSSADFDFNFNDFLVVGQNPTFKWMCLKV